MAAGCTPLNTSLAFTPFTICSSDVSVAAHVSISTVIYHVYEKRAMRYATAQHMLFTRTEKSGSAAIMSHRSNTSGLFPRTLWSVKNALSLPAFAPKFVLCASFSQPAVPLVLYCWYNDPCRRLTFIHVLQDDAYHAYWWKTEIETLIP